MDYSYIYFVIKLRNAITCTSYFPTLVRLIKKCNIYFYNLIYRKNTVLLKE